MSRKIAAFTLIELLIVVAIIGILAAIAVPNYLTAQIQAKVARARDDMLALATAVEAYRVDNHAYPYPDNPMGVPEYPPASDGFETHAPVRLTTPVAYITSLPTDPFKEHVNLTEENKQYNYSTRHYFDLTHKDNQLHDYLVLMVPEIDEGSIDYWLLSHGPDLVHNDMDENPALYDPSNGIRSGGDLVYWGPGIGLKS